MDKMISFMLLMNLIANPIRNDINVSKYQQDKIEKQEKIRNARRENIQNVANYYRQIKEKANETNNDITRINNPFNYELIQYMGEQNGERVLDLVDIVYLKNMEAKQGIGQRLKLQFNDLIAKPEMEEDVYKLYVDTMKEEIKRNVSYIVGFEYAENSNISTVVIFKKDMV